MAHNIQNYPSKKPANAFSAKAESSADRVPFELVSNVFEFIVPPFNPSRSNLFGHNSILPNTDLARAARVCHVWQKGALDYLNKQTAALNGEVQGTIDLLVSRPNSDQAAKLRIKFSKLPLQKVLTCKTSSRTFGGEIFSIKKIEEARKDGFFFAFLRDFNAAWSTKTSTIPAEEITRYRNILRMFNFGSVPIHDEEHYMFQNQSGSKA